MTLRFSSTSARSMPSFSYLQDRINYIGLSTGDTIRIARVDNHVARVYFVDGNGTEVPIPANYIMRDSAGQQVPPLGNNFVVTWTASYALYHLAAAPVFLLKQQKQQAIYAAGHANWGVVEPIAVPPAHPPHGAGGGQVEMSDEEE